MDEHKTMGNNNNIQHFIAIDFIFNYLFGSLSLLDLPASQIDKKYFYSHDSKFMNHECNKIGNLLITGNVEAILLTLFSVPNYLYYFSQKYTTLVLSNI